MMNVVRNAIGLAVLFFIMVGFGITMYVVTQVGQKSYDVVNNAAPNAGTDEIMGNWLSLRILVIQTFYVLVSFIIFFALMSSVVDITNWQGYLMNVIGGLIVTPIVIWIVTSWWNKFIVFGFTFTEISSTFVSSWTLILTANLILGLASFIFTRRGVQ